MRTLSTDQPKSIRGLNYGKLRTRNVHNLIIINIRLSTPINYNPFPQHITASHITNKTARNNLESPEGSECP